MADIPKINGQNRTSSIFLIIKDIAIVIGLIISILTLFGWFSEVKKDIAIIQTSQKYMEKEITDLKIEVRKQ